MRIFGKKYRLPFEIRKRKPSAKKKINDILEGEKIHTVFDVGANKGTVTKEYLDLYPNAKIYSFEPTPDVFKTLEGRFGNHPRVECHAKAVSENEGVATFHLNKSSQTNSLLASGDEANSLFGSTVSQTQTSIEVPTLSLDQFCEQNKIEHINILKMDIQGGELSALKGSKSLLEQQKVDLIFCEVEFYPLYKDQPLYHDIAGLLHNYGYTLFNFDNLNIKKPIHQLLWTDAIFVSKNILDKQLKKIPQL